MDDEIRRKPSAAGLAKQFKPKSPTVLIWIMMPPWSVIRASPRQFFLQSLIAARRDWALELY